MKILLVATVQSHICQFHKPLVEMLREQCPNAEIHVAARNNLGEKNGLKLDFVDRVFDISFSRSPKSLDNINAYKHLKKIINEQGYDVIHCNTPVGGIITRLAARKARMLGTKVYYTAHGFHFYKGAPKKNWILFYPIEKFMASKTDKLITITAEDYNIAKKKMPCDSYRIHGVGVDSNRFYPISECEKNALRRKFGFGEKQKIILCVGELLPNKNQKMAILAMREIVKSYPTAQLLLAGNGSEKDSLESLISSVNLKNNVRLLGYVTNIEEYHHLSDTLVSCSRREGLPLNIIEAMMCGKPVVASNNRGHRELIQNRKTGYLVDVDDYLTMTKNILELWSSVEKYNEFSQKSILCSKQYSSTAVKRELKKIYEL